MIDIHNINGSVLMQVPVTKDAKREEELSKSDYISLSFNAAVKVVLPVGSYIEHTYYIDNTRKVTHQFLLLESYEPTQSDEMSWKYTPQFQHPKMVLGKVPFYINTKNSQDEDIKQTIWSFVGTPDNMMGKVCDFLNKDIKFGNCGWKAVITGDVDNSLSVTFSDNDVLSALTAIAKAAGDNCEWHIDYDNEEIYLGQVVINDTPVLLKVGENIGVPSISESKEGYYNAYTVFGGTRNITQVNSKGENVSSGDIRLQLLSGEGTITVGGKDFDYAINNYSTIDLRQSPKEPLFTKVLNFSDVFPSLDTYVYNVRGREKYVIDSTTNQKVPLTRNDDGSVTYKTFTVWYIRLAYCTTSKIEGKRLINTTVDDGVTHYWYDFEITDDLLVSGKNLSCSFETNFNVGALTTPLAGRGSNGGYVGFELNYHKQNFSSHDSDDVSEKNFDVLAGDYEIIYQEDNNLIIPTNAKDMLIPKGEILPSLKCNITVLYNIAMSGIYVTEAQHKLLDKAKTEIIRLMSDMNNYAFKAYPEVFEKKNPYLQIAQRVTFNDGNGYVLNSRVLKLTTNIDYDFVQEITVGNQALKGTITQLKEDVQTIIANGSGSNSSGGFSASQINSLIAKYGNRYFLSKQNPDTAQGRIAFAEGLTTGAYSEGVSGGSVDADGNAEVGTLTARGDARFGTDSYIKADGAAALGDVLLDALRSKTFDDVLQRGFGLVRDAQGRYTLSVHDLMVWGKAMFTELEIRRLSSVGGNVYLSGASGRIQHVTPVYGTDGTTVSGWKCWLLADDGTTATQNGFVRYDQAKCQTFNIDAGVHEGVGNRYYWRLVTDASTANEQITDAEGNVLYDGKRFAWVVLSATDCENPKTNDAPAEGDVIVLDGHRQFADGDEQGRDKYNDSSRTNVMMLQTTGASTGALPNIVAYHGITDYRHSADGNKYSNTVFILSPEEVVFVSTRMKWISASGDSMVMVNFRGPWEEGTAYYYYDQVSHDNALWTCVVADGKSTTEEPSDTSTVWRKELTGGMPGEKGDKGEDGVAYLLQVTSDRGSVLVNGSGTLTLTGTLYKNGEDITSTIAKSYWSWYRVSADTTDDAVWSRLHEGTGNTCVITSEDVSRVAQFGCRAYVPDATLSARGRTIDSLNL